MLYRDKNETLDMIFLERLRVVTYFNEVMVGIYFRIFWLRSMFLRCSYFSIISVISDIPRFLNKRDV